MIKVITQGLHPERCHLARDGLLLNPGHQLYAVSEAESKLQPPVLVKPPLAGASHVLQGPWRDYAFLDPEQNEDRAIF